MKTVSVVALVAFVACLGGVAGQSDPNSPLRRLDWLKGRWRGEFSGKAFWPTIPTVTFGEELLIQEAPVASATGITFFNFTSKSWSHSTKDHFLDSFGFFTVDSRGTVSLLTTGNNGFTTLEEGPIYGRSVTLSLKKIGRVSFTRDLPVKDLERRLTRLDETYLEQVLLMQTETHPKQGLKEHSRIIYQRIGDR